MDLVFIIRYEYSLWFGSFFCPFSGEIDCMCHLLVCLAKGYSREVIRRDRRIENTNKSVCLHITLLYSRIVYLEDDLSVPPPPPHACCCGLVSCLSWQWNEAATGG